VAQFLTTLVPWAPHDIRTRVIMMVGTFIIIAALAEVTERRKNAWRDGIAKWFDRFGMMRRAFRPTSP
jgi:hypothetical protein